MLLKYSFWEKWRGSSIQVGSNGIQILNSKFSNDSFNKPSEFKKGIVNKDFIFPVKRICKVTIQNGVKES